ncbi:MAG: hypothetical protein HQK50_10770 [Oligoflexia bacterium]|nr:hypothetical protein [Oligoflexia bacterium]
MRLCCTFFLACLLVMATHNGLWAMDAALLGGVDSGTSSNGLNHKAKNLGYSLEALAHLKIFLLLHGGAFYFQDSSKTQKITSNGGSVLQNFHISPTGYGVDFKLQFSPLFLRGGYGSYQAEARRVSDFVGRNYSLASGSGYHLGGGIMGKLFGVFSWVAAITYRNLEFKEIKMKESKTNFVKLQKPWEREVYTFALGLSIDL